MRYTLWSHDQLIGDTDLGFAYCAEGYRMGFLFVENEASRIVEDATALSRVAKEHRRTSDVVAMTSAYAEASAIVEALDLQLRGPDGEVISTLDIGISDDELMKPTDADEQEYEAWYTNLGDAERAEFDASVEHDVQLLRQWASEETAEPTAPEAPHSRYRVVAHFA